MAPTRHTPARGGTASIRLALLVIALCVAPALGQEKPDLSTPKAAATAFASAVMAGDAGRARAVSTGSEKQLKIIDTMVGLIGGIKKLEDTLVARYGAEAVKKAGNGPLSGSDMADTVKRLSEGEVKVTGDTALITPKKKEGAAAAEEPNDPLTLKKVGGEWKVDLASLTKGVEGSEDQIEGMQAFAAMIGGMTKEIAAGKFKTAEEANEAIAAAFIKMGQEQAAKEQAKQPPPKKEERKQSPKGG